MPGAFQIPSVFTAIDRYTAPLRKMMAITNTFAAKSQFALEKVSRAYGQINKRITLMGKNLARSVGLIGGLTLAAGVASGADAFLDLDKNMSAAAAKFQIFDRESEQFKTMRNLALDLGATTEFTAGQVAQGFDSMGAAGFDYLQTMAGIPKIIDLATASQSELGESALIAGKTLGAFDLKTKDPLILAENLDRVNNVLNKLKSQKEFQTLDEVSTTVKGSGASARLAGLDIETWAASVGKAIGPIGDASMVSTQFNMALTRLASPPAAAAKELKKLGVVVDDGKGNFRDFFDIIGDLEKATAGLGTQQKTAALSTIFGARAFKTMSVLISEGKDSLVDYREEFRNTENLTTRMATFMRSGLDGAVKAMQSAFEAVSISIGDTFQPEIDAAILRLTEIARASRIWIQENKTLIKIVFSLLFLVVKLYVAFKVLGFMIGVARAATTAYNVVLGISTLLMGKNIFAVRGNIVAMKAFAISARLATTAQWALNVAMTANPIGLIIAGVAALVVGIIMLVKHFDKVQAAVSKISDKGLLLISVFMPFVGLTLTIIKYWDKIKEIFMNVYTIMKNYVLIAFERLNQLFAKLPGFLQSLLPDWLVNFGSMIWDSIKAVGSSIKTFMEGLVPDWLRNFDIGGFFDKIIEVTAKVATDSEQRLEKVRKGAEVPLDGSEKVIVLPPGVAPATGATNSPEDRTPAVMRLNESALPPDDGITEPITPAANDRKIEAINPQLIVDQANQPGQIEGAGQQKIVIEIVDPSGVVQRVVKEGDQNDTIKVNLEQTFNFD